MEPDNQEPVKSRAGRKTIYSPALVKELLGYIEDGLNIKSACAAAGVGVSTLREWRAEYPGLEEDLNAAREKMRAKILAQIKAAGAGKEGDWKALAEYLRLSFPELRFGNGANVNIALQNNLTLEERDPERARLIAELEGARARALAESAASEPLQITDASDARAIALETERSLQEERSAERLAEAEPERLREHAPRTERADWRDERSRPFRDWEEIGSEDGLG